MADGADGADGVTPGAAAALDAALLEVVVCPVCHGPLDPRGDVLACDVCGCGYPVRAGVPVLLAGDALPLTGSGLAAG